MSHIPSYQESVRLHKRDRVKVQEQGPFSGDDQLYKPALSLELTQVCLQDFIDSVYLLHFACIVTRSHQIMFAASSTVFGT